MRIQSDVVSESIEIFSAFVQPLRFLSLNPIILYMLWQNSYGFLMCIVIYSSLFINNGNRKQKFAHYTYKTKFN